MNVDELRTARERGLRPEAPEADLRWADLRWANLRGADLRGADLRGADLRWADLGWADLSGAGLRWADLRGADLRGADLRWADLSGAGLREAGIISLGETPSGWTCIYPTPEGWVMQVGCWRGTPDDLRAIATDLDGEWPSRSDRPEREGRAPYLLAILAHADLITAEFAHLIPELAAKWGGTE